MPASPVSEKTDLTTYTVLANGGPIPRTFQVLRVEIRKAVNRIPTASVVLRDGSTAAEDFPVSDLSTFLPGTEIDVRAGYHGTNDSIFRGVVTRQAVHARRDGSTLTVWAKDQAFLMTLSRSSAYFVNKTDSDVIEEIAGAYSGVSVDVAGTSPPLEQLVQFDATDWDFILTRAGANGFVTVVNGGAITMQPPALDQTAVLTLTYGVDVLTFDSELDGQSQWASVESHAWDPTTQAMIDATAPASNFYSLGNITTPMLTKTTGGRPYALRTAAGVPQAELTAWAKAMQSRAELSKIHGTIRMQGSALVEPGNTIALKGMGSRFNGLAFVGAVTHTLADGNWETELETGLPFEWFGFQPDVSSTPAAGLLPAVRGLATGKVKQIDADPHNELRVRVEIPVVGGAPGSVWARLATYYATSQAGAFFYPELEDEVVLGFLNDDPRYPIILGSVHSSGRPPAYTPAQENPIKAVVTAGKLRIEFDDQNKILTVQTPNKNQAVFSDKDASITISDANGNSIKLSSSGIALTSASSVVIKATESIQIEAGTGITVKGGPSASVTAGKISISADTEVSVTGNATDSLTSSGETSVKGSLVMIN